MSDVTRDQIARIIGQARHERQRFRSTAPTNLRDADFDAADALIRAFPALTQPATLTLSIYDNDVLVDDDFVDHAVDSENVSLLRDLVYALWARREPVGLREASRDTIAVTLAIASAGETYWHQHLTDPGDRAALIEDELEIADALLTRFRVTDRSPQQPTMTV